MTTLHIFPRVDDMLGNFILLSNFDFMIQDQFLFNVKTSYCNIKISEDYNCGKNGLRFLIDIC